MTYTVTTRPQGSNTVMEVRDTISYNIRKVFSLAGTVITPPMIEGDSFTVAMKDNSNLRKIYKINMKTGARFSRLI